MNNTATTRTAPTTSNPWHVQEVTHCTAGIRIVGHNDYTDAPIRWQLSEHSFNDAAFVAQRYDFKGAQWTPKARAAFARLVTRAKALRA